MDVTPITAKILGNARLTAESYLSEAGARISDMQDACDRYVQQQQAAAVTLAHSQGEAMEQNLRRLGALNDRKDLLALKHRLIDEGFDAARKALHALPEEKLRALFLSEVQKAAQGTETLTVGAVSPGFFQGFIEEANALLIASGKPGELKDSGHQRAGVCGVILSLPGSETQCTAETLLRAKRDQLEGEVAYILCAGLT